MDSLFHFFDPIRGVSWGGLIVKIILAVFFGGMICNRLSVIFFTASASS